MFRSCVVVLALCGMVALFSLPVSNAQEVSVYDLPSSCTDKWSDWGAIRVLCTLLEQQGSLDGHALARKSVRSPSRRLRFGRRSNPETPSQAPADETDELLSLRDLRTPLRLRFGRRSEEHAVPHIFPQEEQGRSVRAPSMRLRFGRRSDNNMFLMPYEPTLPKDLKAGFVEEERQQE